MFGFAELFSFLPELQVGVQGVENAAQPVLRRDPELTVRENERGCESSTSQAKQILVNSQSSLCATSACSASLR